MPKNSRKPRIACWVAMSFFFNSGFVYAVWGVNIPLITTQFKLSALQLTVALFAVAAGAIITMTYIGRWISRQGSALACQIGALLLALSMSVIMIAPCYELLLAVLMMFGATQSIFDTAMNAQAVTVEQVMGKPLLSAMHGMFSVGGIVGALAGSTWNSYSLSSGALFNLAGLGLISFVLLGRRFLLIAPLTPSSPFKKTSVSAKSTATMIGLLSFFGFVVEGAMYDWTAIYMRDNVQADVWWMGVGYAGFCTGMMVGRFSGDRLRSRCKDIVLLQLSGILACLGLSLALAYPVNYAVVVGFTLVGLGSANFVPILFAAGARLHGLSAAEGIALVSRLGYFGFLLGPVMIGSISSQFGLPIGLALVGVSALVIVWKAAVLNVV